MENAERYYFAYLSEPVEVGTSSNHTPQHLTLVPPFVHNGAGLRGVVRDALSDLEAFDITVNGTDKFGPKKDIPVYLVENTPQLQQLHSRLIEQAGRRGINTAAMGFVGENFRPHISIKRWHEPLELGERLHVDHVAVIQKRGGRKTVITKVNLDGS